MKKYILLSLVLSYFNIVDLSAQKNNQLNSWWTYSGNHKVAQKISLHTLYSFRRSNFVADWQQSLLRIGINYHYSDKLIFTPGYDWVVIFPYGEQPIGKETTEQRIYEQIVLKNTVGRLGIVHRYHLEQRFSNNTVQHRFRYRLTTKIPLGKNETNKQHLFLSIFDEVFVNLGEQPTGHYFDQNWFYVGLGYPFKNGLTIKMGYMNQYLVKFDNRHIENNHTPQFALSYDLDFPKRT
ncbi:MAG: hypothetical protein ACJAYJ_004269 [Saprospiraceae bacterium]|jgi:hypothetical protein